MFLMSKSKKKGEKDCSAIVSVGLSIDMIKIMTYRNLERKGFISVSHSVTEGSQGRNLELRTEAEAVEECCFLACS